MPRWWERRSRRAFGDRAVRSPPSNSTLPEVGSARPFSRRSSVDLPDPDRPMTTKSSPGSTAKEASITAAVVPSARSSSRSAPSLTRRTPSLALRPKTLNTCSATSFDTCTSSRTAIRTGREAGPSEPRPRPFRNRRRGGARPASSPHVPAIPEAMPGLHKGHTFRHAARRRTRLNHVRRPKACRRRAAPQVRRGGPHRRSARAPGTTRGSPSSPGRARGAARRGGWRPGRRGSGAGPAAAGRRTC